MDRGFLDFAISCQVMPKWHVKSSTIDSLMNELSDEILTLEEVAAYLKAGRRTVYRLAANGQIPAFKLGGTWRFRRTELDQWIAARISTQGKSNLDEGES
jgi:excisionase family DNA binding protein